MRYETFRFWRLKVLSYTVSVTLKLITMMLIMGLMFAYVKTTYPQRVRKIFNISVIVGIVAALIMAYLKNATKLIDTSRWNMRIFPITFGVILAFYIFTLIGKKLGKAKDVLPAVFLSLHGVLLLFYTLPDFLAYPYTLLVSESTVFSSSYIIKFGGVLLGFILTLVAGFAVNRGAVRAGRGINLAVLSIAILINEIKQIAAFFSILLTKRIVSTDSFLFDFVVWASNNSDLFIYLTLAACLAISVILLIRGMHVNEPYANSAEHRKIKAKWRNIRRWAATAFATTVLTVLVMTVIDAYANAAVELSPTEDAIIDEEEGVLKISFEQVSDGHLHRFGYTTENGVQVRVIVIQKPNSTAYGVGMDACDICGETGYYEKDGQVVCNRCDVVMNINTIGFKGGCNPKIVDYKVEAGYINISLESMLQYEKDFK